MQKKREPHLRQEESGPHSPIQTPADHFWWSFFERQEVLQERLRDWASDTTASLATREERIGTLQELIRGMTELAQQDSSEPQPKELVRLQGWYAGATREQREAWARPSPTKEGPNVPTALQAGVGQPLGRQPAQEGAILDALREMGFDPQRLPVPSRRGAPSPAKQAARDKLKYSKDVLNKAWQRLRNDGLIKDDISA